MAEIETGFWLDRSQPAVFGATLTLPLYQANPLLSFLALLITLAAGSFWNLTAILLHRVIAKRTTRDALGLQHQVAVQNLGTSPKVIWASIKLYHAWLGRGVQHLTLRTLGILLPAVLVWALFSAASVLSSRVATTSDAISRLRSGRCGFWEYDNGNISHAVRGQSLKVANDSIQARNYVSTFYNRAPASIKGLSPLKVVTLPIEVNTSALCPFRNLDRCQLGHNRALSMATPPLNSHDVFGINAYPSDQVTFQYEATCSPVKYLGDFEVYTNFTNDPTDVDRRIFWRALFGPYQYKPGEPLQNFTHQIYEETANTQAGYVLEYDILRLPIDTSDHVLRKKADQFPNPRPFYAIADSFAPPTWIPIADFRRTDADSTMFFLSQNRLVYLEPTYDPWFFANGSVRGTFQAIDGILSTYFMTAMGCMEQFKICNPAKGADACSPLTGLAVLQRFLINNDIGLNDAQLMTAIRILTHMTPSTLYYNVMSLRGTSLWANDLVYGTFSPGLPENQWQVEALGWFQSSLTKLQLYTAEFAANAGDLGPYGSVRTPRGMLGNLTGSRDLAQFEALQDQCSNQLVRTTGEVQNFSVLGLMIILCVSLTIIILDMASGVLIGWVSRRGRRPSPTAAARQADNMFHLLRLALPGPFSSNKHWELGRWGMPVLSEGSHVLRPYFEEESGLATYQDSNAIVQYDSTGSMKGEKMTGGSNQIEVDSLLLRD